MGRAQCGFFALMLEKKTAQQAAGSLQTVLCAGAHVGNRVEVLVEGGDAGLDPRGTPALLDERAFRRARAAGNACQPAEGEAGTGHPLGLHVPTESGAHSPNSL